MKDDAIFLGKALLWRVVWLVIILALDAFISIFSARWGLIAYGVCSLGLVFALARRLFFPNFPKKVYTDPLGIALSVGLTRVPLVGALVGGKSRGDQWIKDSKHNVLTYLATAATGPLVFPILFSQACRCLYIIWGGFDAVGTGYWYWVKFGLDWEMESLLFNVPQIYGISFSEIQPVAWWARLVVVIFVLILQGLVISALYNMFQFRDLYRVLHYFDGSSNRNPLE